MAKYHGPAQISFFLFTVPSFSGKDARLSSVLRGFESPRHRPCQLTLCDHCGSHSVTGYESDVLSRNHRGMM